MRLFFSLILFFLSCSTVAHATDKYWQGTTNRTWELASNWRDDSLTGPTSTVAPGAEDAVLFDTAAGGTSASPITVASAKTIASFAFVTAGWTITGSTFTVSSSNVVVSVGTTTISSVFAGTAGLTKTGAGTLALSGTNTYSGETSILQGTLRAITSATALPLNADV